MKKETDPKRKDFMTRGRWNWKVSMNKICLHPFTWASNCHLASSIILHFKLKWSSQLLLHHNLSNLANTKLNYTQDKLEMKTCLKWNSWGPICREGRCHIRREQGTNHQLLSIKTRSNSSIISLKFDIGHKLKKPRLLKINLKGWRSISI